MASGVHPVMQQLHTSIAGTLICLPILALADVAQWPTLDPVMPQGWAWLWLFGVGTLFETLVFAFAIGNCCWLFIDLGRMGVTRWLQPRQVASATDWQP